MPAAKPIAILAADHALRQSLAFALAAEGFASETFSAEDWHRAAQDNQRFLCFIIDEQALPVTSIEMIGLAAPIILLADGLGSHVDVAGARVIYKPSQGSDILAVVRTLSIPAHA
ncbi:response regulator receiver protein [Rhizobium sp. PDO1-076]|uniref:hypothetical protein n=1 Tax=Rhizobium sp. PDO1-076 TaxID=1125979 RepID=UPI00024E3786|nr:hypothetical protein [Rhizobium sp. PDO1-076]EHS51387.1 response regulator receiver protein [Rhizobium sp. PDO1-076]